jgi:SAM-dependent methyltransferase
LVAYYPHIYSFAPDLAQQSRPKQWWSRLEYLLFYRPMYAADARRVASHTGAARTQGQRMLDIGCGRGLRLLEFRRLGYRVYGADFQPELVDYLQREHGIQAACCDIPSLQRAFGTESFDAITAYYVVEHVLNVEELLSSCLMLLKPGGWFVGAIPLADSLQAAWFQARWSQATEAPRHISLPSKRGVCTACELAGFVNVSVTADSRHICAEAFALSVVPGAMASGIYGRGGWTATSARFVGMAVMLLVSPWCWTETHVFQRPAFGLVLAQKPKCSLPPVSGGADAIERR